jgi:hypothetical protein
MARGGQMNSQSWQATQRTRPFDPAPMLELRGNVRHLAVPFFFRILHRHLGTTKSMFLKCFKVIAIPLRIAGR